MKKIFLLIVLSASVTLISGQKSIDDLFEKYAGKDGFTTVTINGNILKLASCFGDNGDDDSIPSNITELRILVQDNDSMQVENFYKRIIGDLDLKNYEEFMRIKESGQDLRMLVRTEGNKFKEFLLIAGGEDNAFIQIKGNMTFKEAKKFSCDAKINHGMNIAGNHK